MQDKYSPVRYPDIRAINDEAINRFSVRDHLHGVAASCLSWRMEVKKLFGMLSLAYETHPEQPSRA